MTIEEYRNVFHDLSEAELKFLLDEFSVDENWIDSSDEDMLDDLYDRIADVEVDEIDKAGDGPLSLRGKLASSIITKVGETFMVHEDGVDDDWE